MLHTLRITIHKRYIPPYVIWPTLANIYRTYHDPNELWQVDDVMLPLDDVLGALDAKTVLIAATDQIELTCHRDGCGVMAISVGELKPRSPSVWDYWVTPFLGVPSFLCATAYDKRYSESQNIESVPMLVQCGYPYDKSKVHHDDDLNMDFVDISSNPGRREFRDGYIEEVGGTMWLGETFWRVTGANKDEVMAQDWIRSQPLPFGALKIEVGDGLFDSPEGVQGEWQNRLRALLYPASRTDERNTEERKE